MGGNCGGIRSLAVLLNGQLASGSEDGTIRVWDTATGEESARLEGHRKSITALAVLPDGQLASGSWDQTIRMWDLKTGAERACLNSGDGWQQLVTSLAALPDGRLAVSFLSGPIWLWDTNSGEQPTHLVGHDLAVGALAVLNDGLLAIGGAEKVVRLWDIPTAPSLTNTRGHRSGVFCLAELPNGCLASGSEDESIRIWDSETGLETGRMDFPSDRFFALKIREKDGFEKSDDEYQSEQRSIRWDPTTDSELERPIWRVWPEVLLPSGGRAGAKDDGVIRLYGESWEEVTSCLEIDCEVNVLMSLSNGRLIAGDRRGRIHWLAIKGATGMELAGAASRRCRRRAPAEPA